MKIELIYNLDFKIMDHIVIINYKPIGSDNSRHLATYNRSLNALMLFSWVELSMLQQITDFIKEKNLKL